MGQKDINIEQFLFELYNNSENLNGREKLEKAESYNIEINSIIKGILLNEKINTTSLGISKISQNKLINPLTHWSVKSLIVILIILISLIYSIFNVIFSIIGSLGKK